MNRLSWLLPVYTALTTSFIFLLDALAEPDGLLYFLFTILVIVLLLIFLVAAAVEKRRARCVSILSILIVYSILSFALLRNEYAIRNAARWFLWSRRYKAEVLAQSAAVHGEFRHVEWDGWNFQGLVTPSYISSSTQWTPLRRPPKDTSPANLTAFPAKFPQ